MNNKVRLKDGTIILVRWMIRMDLPAVLRIDAATSPFPWSEDDFIGCLRQRNCIGMVAEDGNKTLGFMIYELHKTRIEILKLAVDPACLRNGVGSGMVERLVSKLASHHRRSITLNVRERSLAAQLFLRGRGFLGVSVEAGFYDDSGEDAFRMAYRVAEAKPVEETGEKVNRIARHGE